jgi:ion channel
MPKPAGRPKRERFEQLSRSARRRLLRRALVRPTIVIVVLFALYFGLPLDHHLTEGTWFIALAGALLFVGLVAWQARAISRSPYPRLTAITSLAFTIPLFVLLFATAYFLLEQNSPGAFTQPMTRLDALYFTVTVLTTVGFGDISAHSEVARAITTAQMIGDLLLIGLAVRVLLGAVQTGLTARDKSTDGSDATEQ